MHTNAVKVHLIRPIAFNVSFWTQAILAMSKSRRCPVVAAITLTNKLVETRAQRSVEKYNNVINSFANYLSNIGLVYSATSIANQNRQCVRLMFKAVSFSS